MTEQVRDLLHDGYRELISARLDEPLAGRPAAELATHLEGCSRCRQFDHDLVEQRRLLRSLPPMIPPRDLWARTSAALDRELLREADHDGGIAPEPRASGRLGELTNPTSVPSMLMVSVASVGLAIALLITQLGPTLRLPAEVGGQPTPFGIEGVALAFVGADSGGLTLYRTRVDEGCEPAGSCDDGEIAARVTFPASFEPSNLALAPRGDRLAIMGSDAERENVFAVLVVPPLDALAPDTDYPTRPRGQGGQNATPAASPDASLVVVGRTPAPSLPAGGTSRPVIPAELKVSTILDDVYAVGAPPAWSPDGQALAFSAMPTDRSRGPDIYVWRVGDERAKPLTTDHGSYFASWSGNVIVASRAIRARNVGLLESAPVIQTVGIDIATGEERTVAADGLWLPHVDPASRRAVAWRGSLAWDGAQAVPQHGALHMIDWAAIDPFATPEPQPTPGDVPAAPETPAAPAETTDGSTTAIPSAGPVATRRPAGYVIATDEPRPTPTDETFGPIEPARDVLRHPVLDWRVVWAADSRRLGVWVGDADVTGWGRLTVFAVDLQGRLDRQELLVDSTPAKRGFNIARNRVAWVAPTEGRSGELRLRMWDPAGVHDVRVRPIESTGVVAAF